MKSSSVAESIINCNNVQYGVRDTDEPCGISTPNGQRMKLRLRGAQHTKPDKTGVMATSFSILANELLVISKIDIFLILICPPANFNSGMLIKIQPDATVCR